MDTKNVIAAISLSAAVIILYSLFFAPPVVDQKNISNDKNTSSQNSSSDAPSLVQDEKIIKISRDEALEENERILFENDKIKGSISLLGSSIDDLTFKNYTNTLNGDDNVVLLNPKQSENGYYVETGWATTNKNIDLPNSKTLWEIEGNKKLTPNSSIKLSWKNNQNIKFTKEISIDNQYLFDIKQTIENKSDKTYNFYPYGQIIRNIAPEVTNFYILHEGLIGVFVDQLVEEDYDDIEEKKYSINANTGWLGITDKYWIASLIPENGKSFRSDFDYKNKFRANFVATEPLELGKNSSIEDTLQIIVAAKRVDVIDQYAESLKIEKFDLAIDWGILYWITRPLFTAIDYFFKIFGNKIEIETLIKNELNKDFYEIIHTDKVVKSTDSPLEAAKRGKDTSMWLSIESLKQNELI